MATYNSAKLAQQLLDEHNSERAALYEKMLANPEEFDLPVDEDGNWIQTYSCNHGFVGSPMDSSKAVRMLHEKGLPDA